MQADFIRLYCSWNLHLYRICGNKFHGQSTFYQDLCGYIVFRIYLLGELNKDCVSEFVENVNLWVSATKKISENYVTRNSNVSSVTHINNSG